MEKVIVQFIKGNGQFVTGDITQLDRAEAEALLKQKMIVIIDGDCNVTNTLPDTKLPPTPTDKFICPICGKEFKNQKALRMHKLKAHSIKE
jgi:hypothetical protein